MGRLRNQIAGLGLLGKGTEQPVDPLADLKRLIAFYPGPAILVTADGEILDCNTAGLPLQREFTECRSDAGISMRQATEKAAPALLLVKLENRNGDKTSYDLALTPFHPTPEQLVFLFTGRDGSMQYNLIDALVASRQLFKDLITCTAEFVWETDEEGRFRYTSPRGAFGYSAAELDGMLVEDLLMDVRSNPFFSESTAQEQEVWLRAKSGEAVCMMINSVPVKDKSGQFCGNRGAGRDVTADIRQKQHMEFIAAQDLMVDNIVGAIRQEVDVDRLFSIAGSGACEALHSSRVIIQRLTLSGHLEVAFNKGVPGNVITELSDWFWQRRKAEDLADDVILSLTAQEKLHIAPINVKGSLNGLITLVRSPDALDLSADEENLLKILAGHLGVALIQVNAREQLVELSRTDELSGLLNRRAFHEDVIKRIEHGKRTQRPNTLFYIDLDNFKPVNDRFGHEKGDEVLKKIAQVLKENSRIGDLVSRLGGDEFAVWFEDMDRAAAIAKAEEMQRACLVASNELDVQDPSLSFSIGVALSDGDEADNLERLLSRADAAMYEVKRQGKGTYALAKKE